MFDSAYNRCMDISMQIAVDDLTQILNLAGKLGVEWENHAILDWYWSKHRDLDEDWNGVFYG